MDLSFGFKKYLFNTSWLMAERVFRMAMGLFVGIFAARYLGPAQFGLLSYAISFVGLFITFSTLGLDGIVVRELIRKPDRRDEILGTTFSLKILGVCLMWVFIFCGLFITDNDPYTIFLISTIAFSAIFQAFNVIDFNYQAEVRAKFVVHGQLIQVILSSIFKFFLIGLKAPLFWFAFAYLVDALILALALIIIYSIKTDKVLSWRFNFNLSKRLIKDSWPLILTGISISIYMRIDQIMIKHMIDSKELGLYSAAIKISEAWYFVPIVICNSLFPAIINSKLKNRDNYTYNIYKLYRLLFALSLLFSIPVALFSDYLIILLFGDNFSQAGGVLKILVWNGPLVSLGIASGKWLLNENLQILSFYRTFIGMIINIVANTILIPKYSIIGAAYSTLLSQFFSTYLFDLFSQKTRKQFLLKTLSIPGINYVFKNSL